MERCGLSCIIFGCNPADHTKCALCGAPLMQVFRRVKGLPITIYQCMRRCEFYCDKDAKEIDSKDVNDVGDVKSSKREEVVYSD